MEIPSPKVKQRKIDTKRENAYLLQGATPLLARIVASRPFIDIASDNLFSFKLQQLDSPSSLADVTKAVDRLILALQNQEVIALETDHDCDGQTSHAVLYTVLVDYFGHPPHLIQSFIGHRLKDGYGLSEAVALRILAKNPRPSLVLTADNGSGDEQRIALLKSEGIDVIVTDHHEIPIEGIPRSAYAVINPTREDCAFPDRYIAGCMVAWLFMAATRARLIQQGKQIPSLAACLDFVAVGTIADCVSIARSYNNRAVVSYGMKLIQQGLRPCWRALLPLLSTPLSSEDLGFKIGPLLNSDGRLASAFGSVSFLLAQSDEDAKHWVAYLQTQNMERKSIQENVTQMALKQAIKQFQAGKVGLSIFLEEGHAGVHGISASRIKDMFGRPVIIFCPKMGDSERLTGSARSIEGVHIRDILQEIYYRAPQAIERFGGHQGAAGLTLSRQYLPLFDKVFEEVLSEHVSAALIGPVIWTDGELPIADLTIEFIEKLVGQLEPFGREFEFPTFETQGKIISIHKMGEAKTHARLGLVIDDLWLEAVWFNCCGKDKPMKADIGDTVCVVFAPKLQTFRGQRKLSCQIMHLEVV
ncbi:MAG: single-stranded-DNA-specific exonuclease RecJ [Proteobacteria bacterium]|nr:single-stranded-DNA-specific exonuclease RecJ [Pseudomonadota bacterium]